MLLLCVWACLSWQFPLDICNCNEPFDSLQFPICCAQVYGLVFVSGPCVFAECFCLVQQMHMQNLCSGTGSVSKAFVRGGWEIVDVDWDPRHGPTHCVDIMSWECPYPPYFSMLCGVRQIAHNILRHERQQKHPGTSTKQLRLFKRVY